MSFLQQQLDGDFPFQTTRARQSMANFLQTHRKPFLVFVAIVHFSSLFNLSLAFHPADYYLINCGSSTETKIHSRTFTPDSDTESIRVSTSRKLSVKDKNPSPNSFALYHTARVFSSQSLFEFQINNKGTHLIRLHFSPFVSQEFNLSGAVFHVSALGFVLLSEFKVQNKTHVIKEYLVRVDDDKLVVSFIPVSFAFINAIEVLSAPEELIADVARSVTPLEIEDYNGLSKQALETVYRINVGGPLVTPFNDTMWRTWIPDDDFLKLGSPKAISYSGRIKYQLGGASQSVAPDNVYNSARVLNERDASETDSKVTWSFPVKLGYKYLIRMHFCDIVSQAANELYFNVYINGFFAYKDLDLSDIMNQMLAAPYYVDFVADPESSGVLSISIGSSSLSEPSRVNAILNGVEIMRMNNSIGSLDGELSASLISESWTSGTVGVFLCSVLSGFAFMSLLVTGFMLLSRKGSMFRDSVAWSPLPTDAGEDKSRYVKAPLLDKLGYY